MRVRTSLDEAESDLLCVSESVRCGCAAADNRKKKVQMNDKSAATTVLWSCLFILQPFILYVRAHDTCEFGYKGILFSELFQILPYKNANFY